MKKTKDDKRTYLEYLEDELKIITKELKVLEDELKANDDVITEKAEQLFRKLWGKYDEPELRKQALERLISSEEFGRMYDQHEKHLISDEEFEKYCDDHGIISGDSDEAYIDPRDSWRELRGETSAEDDIQDDFERVSSQIEAEYFRNKN